MNKADVVGLIKTRMLAKEVRQGRVPDLMQEFEAPSLLSERTLHSDRYMERVAADLPGFLWKYFNFPNDGYQPQHIYRALQTMFAGGRYVFQWATDHGKSMTGMFFYPIASLAADPDAAHIIMGANEVDAKRRLQMVQRELETNTALTTDFPWLKKPRKVRDSSGGLTWSRKELTIDGRSTNNPNPSLYACTTGSNDVRGRRGKLVMDDIEGEDARRMASSRQQLYDFVKLEAATCLEDLADTNRPLVCAMGTPFDIDSIYIKLENEDWTTVKIPAYSVPWEKIHMSAYMKLPDGSQSNTATPWRERAALLPDRYFTWPRKRFKIAEHDPWFGNQMTKTHFAIRYLLDPSVGNPERLTYEQMRKLVESAAFGEDDHWLSVVSFDPAAGVGKDYAGISVVRIRWPKGQKLPQVEVLESYPFTQGLFEQVAFLADLCHKYPDENGTPARLVYESNAQQGGTYRNAFSHMRPEIQLVPVYTSAGAKFDTEMGLTVIRTLVKQQLLKVPASMLDSEGMQTLLREVRDLGTTADDHIACSVWFVIRWLYEQVRIYSGPQLVTAGSGRLGWGSGMVGGGGQVPSWRTWRG